MVRTSRLLQLCGVLIALVGLAGFWAARLGFFGIQTELRTVLNDGQRQLLGVGEDDFHVSFLLAGREIFYGAAQAVPVYDSSGRIVCWHSQGVRHVEGVNTDTVIYASLTNQAVTMVMLPRGLFFGSGTAKINGVYYREGPDALRSVVSEILGVPVDYHVIINLEIFQNLVDAVGGVELDVPTRMYHHDCSANLTIDLQPGYQLLDGVQASHFIRFRNSLRGDIDRVNNVNMVAYALLGMVHVVHVGSIIRLPDILEAVFVDVESNVSLGFILQELLPRVSGISISNAGTLSTREITRDGVLGEMIDERE